MTNTFTDEIPEVMSNVLREATIVLKAAMPSKMRNSPEFESLLFDMAGTGRGREAKRLKALTDWMFDIALPQAQGLADRHGFGEQWRAMCEKKTPEAANAAARASAADATFAAAATTFADADAYYAEKAVNSSDFWENVSPVGVLKRMTYLEVESETPRNLLDEALNG